MHIVHGLPLQFSKVVIDPRDAFIQPFGQADAIVPAELPANLCAVEHIGRVLAKPFADNLHVFRKINAELGADPFNQIPHRDDFVGGDMIGLAGNPVRHHPPRRVGNVAHVDEGTARMPAAVQAELAAGLEEQNRARNDAVKLLTGPIDVGGAREHDGKFIGLEEGAQAHVGGGARYGIRRARIERRVFLDEAVGTAIHLRRGDIDVLFEVIAPAQLVVQFHRGNDIGLKPVLWMFPAFADHALGGEIDHITRLLPIEQAHDLVEVTVEIVGEELERASVVAPLIGQECRRRFRRAARADHVGSPLQRVVDEARSGERITADNDDFSGHVRSARHAKLNAMPGSLAGGFAAHRPIGAQPLHDHVRHHHLQILADLHVVDGKMDRDVRHRLGLAAGIAEDGVAAHADGVLPAQAP